MNNFRMKSVLDLSNLQKHSLRMLLNSNFLQNKHFLYSDYLQKHYFRLILKKMGILNLQKLMFYKKSNY